MSEYQNSGRHNLMISNTSFKNMAELKYFGIIVTNENCINEGIMMRLNFGNACYHSVQNLLYSCLILKNLKYTEL
jgi:hypothetical protein